MSKTYAGIPLHPARWWHHAAQGKIICTLCPRFCHLSEGQRGFCYVRKHLDGQLYTLAYGRSTGLAIDPVEKKPLFHFLPGSSVMSFGTAGCNLGCLYCENWDISKAEMVQQNTVSASPEHIVELALAQHCESISMTYNEPTIFAEYAIDVARLARQNGLKTILVTNGYVSAEARGELYQYIDAANVDLKAFSETFYQQTTLSHLGPVLDTLKWLHHETEVWLEITNLMIPGYNDTPGETQRMVEWILRELGDQVPLHFTGFYPDYKMLDVPPTPARTLQQARKTAMLMGIKYCYDGNLHDPLGQTTYCPNCARPLIERDGLSLTGYHLAGARCPDCAAEIKGVFQPGPVQPKALQARPRVVDSPATHRASQSA